MGNTGSCYDNARMENFFATLKKELIYRRLIYKMSRDAVRQCVFEWIEGYYNKRRRHTSNENNMVPLVKREMFISKTQTVV
jgi:transposase InsO family protein